MGLFLFIFFTFCASVFADNIWLDERGDVPPMSGAAVYGSDYGGNRAGPVRDRVGENLLVSEDEEHHHQNETVVVVNPSDPDHILGGCNDYRTGDVLCGWYVSFDGGETWEDGVVDHLDRFARAGDPCVVMDREGTAWFCGIHYTRNTPDGGIFCSRSDDGGLNWNEPAYVIAHEDEQDAPFEDKPYMGIDITGGDHDGNLYISWTRYGTGQIHFSRSTDGGENWSDPLRLTGGRGQGSLPVVGTDGSLYVIWKDYSVDRMIGRKSVNGGESFQAQFTIANTDNLPNNLPPTEFRVNSIPSACVDHSDGEYRGRIYVAWADERSGDADILLCWSDDGAENWTDPIRLNDDEVENGIDQFFPWICVDPSDGTLYAVWYDRRSDEDNIFIDLYGVRWSGEGGLPDNERISSESCDPRIGFDGAFIGDYNGIAALAGKAHPAWADTRNDNQDIYYATFTDERRFAAEEGEQSHDFTIEQILINGEEPDGYDEAAVIDAEDEIIGTFQLEGDPPYEFNASGNWETAHGFAYMRWKVWDHSEREEMFAAPVVIEGERVFSDDGATTLELYAPPPDTFRLRVGERFNLVSIPLHQTDIDPYNIFLPYEENVFRVVDEFGRFLTYEWGFTNMHPIDPLRGCLLGIENNAEMEFYGVRIDAQHPIPIMEGWNMIAYLPDYPLTERRAFAGIVDDIFLVKDDQGLFYAPDWDFSNMDLLVPGKSYQVKADNDVELIYPECREEAQFAHLSEEPVHFKHNPKSPHNMSLLISEFQAQGSGEIGAFTENGALCGSVVADGKPPYGMAVWKPSEEDRFEGSALRFKYWDKRSNSEFELSYELIEGECAFHTDSFGVLNLSLADPEQIAPDRFEILGVAPNPFNHATVVEFSIPQESTVDICLFDINGGKVFQTVGKKFVAGRHKVALDGSNLSNGVYFIRLKSEKFSDFKRTVFLK